MWTVGDTTLIKLLVYRRYIQSEHPWALTIHGQQLGVGTYSEKPTELTQEPHHLWIIKIGERGCLHGDGHLLGTMTVNKAH